ncbi:SusC/RagA family TonB-linked outer membrane protein [Bacteroides sp.]
MKKNRIMTFSVNRPPVNAGIVCRAVAAFALGGLLSITPSMAFADGLEQQTVQQQGTIKVTGIVKDAAGEPVIGANIVVKGTNNGTISDIDGNFNLTVSPNSVLVVSFLGYKTQEINVGRKTNLNINLKDDAQALDEVVVVGFGTQKKVNLTGAVSTVDTKVLADRPVVNAVQSLQGAVPGLQITSNSGALDKTANIKIRGTGTIGSSSDSPLILIDGMEGDINTINPQDIENISVLKDAAASSIYGSRAPYGVILVTTKNGRAGKAKVSYNNNFRWGTPTRLPDMVDSWTFANYFNTANQNAGNGSFFQEDVMDRIYATVNGLEGAVDMVSSNGKEWSGSWTEYSANTDWYDLVYKDWAFSQEHNVSVNGGTEKMNYYASANFMDQSGLCNVASDNMKRYTITGKFSAELSKWARLDFSTRFVRKDYDKPSALGGALYDNLSMNGWPTTPSHDPYGNWFTGLFSEVAKLDKGGRSTSQSDDLYMQGALVLEPIKGWVTHLEGNYRVHNTSDKSYWLLLQSYYADGSTKPRGGTSSVGHTHTRQNYMNLNAYTEYSHSFMEKHNLKVMFGFQTEGERVDYDTHTGYGLINDEFPYEDLTSGFSEEGEEAKPTVGGNYNRWVTAAFFGRANYDYKGIYLAEVNLRYDGSSRFRRDQRWDVYPSFSLGYNIAREEFWESIEPYVNMLKVRGSYGELGNQYLNDKYSNGRLVYKGQYPTYPIINVYSNNGSWLQGGKKTNTAYLPAIISTSMTWERIKSWNIGLDFGLLNNRLTGSFDYFERRTTGMITGGMDLPAVLGTSAPDINSADLRTSGFELAVNWQDRLKCGFGYNIGFTLSDSQTKVLKYNPNLTGDLGKYIADQYTGNIYGYETVGIAQTDEEMMQHLDQLDQNYYNTHGEWPIEPRKGQSSLGSDWKAGDIMYADLNGDGEVNSGEYTLNDHGDYKKIGNSNPRYFFGINLGADWKGFDFSAFFQGVMKRDIWQDSWLFWGATGDGRKSTCFYDHLDYWSEDNPDAYYPRPYFLPRPGGGGDKHLNKNQYCQTRYLQNAAYIRLKNIQLGYTLPAKWTNKFAVSKLRIYVSGENLWVGTGMAKMFDPETVDGGNGDGKNKNIGEAYPLSKTISFGLSLTL